jgi:Zn-dependent protease
MMHDDQEQLDRERLSQPRQQNKERRGVGTAGGILVALGVAAAKLKSIVAAVGLFKVLVFGPKLLLSFGSVFLSLWFYAILFGWKFGIVFVLQILVHEMGHYLTFRNFGVPVSLPLFVPGLGAFVSSPMTADPARNAVAALMGPVFGVAAAAVCWAYGLATGEAFWLAAAYVGFFLNLFNLIPAYPFDGGRVAGAIDGRIWLVGVVLLLGWIVVNRAFTAFTIIIVIFVLASSVPRALAAWRGQVDLRVQIASPAQRGALALAYFALIGIAVAGAAATARERGGIAR